MAFYVVVVHLFCSKMYRLKTCRQSHVFNATMIGDNRYGFSQCALASGLISHRYFLLLSRSLEHKNLRSLSVGWPITLRLGILNLSLCRLFCCGFPSLLFHSCLF